MKPKNLPAIRPPFSLLMLALLIVGRAAFGQNVGIGTSAPQEKLHVAGSLRVDALAGVNTRLVAADANGTLIDIAAGAAGQVLVQGAAGPAWQDPAGWLTTGNAGTNPAANFLGTTDAQGLAFRTNNVEAVRITPDGLVCVNGTGPFGTDRFSSYAAGGQTALNGYAFGSGYGAYLGGYGTQSTLASWAQGSAGSAGQFISAHGTAGAIQPTIYAYNGTAAAAGLLVRSDYAHNDAHGIVLDVNGASAKRGLVVDMDAATTGPGEAVLHYGLGHGLTLQSFNTANPMVTLLSHQAGTGKAVEGITFLASNTNQTAYFGQGSTGLTPATYSNATAVWGQSGVIRGGAFLAGGASASTTVLQALYNGPAANVDAVGIFGISAPNVGYGYGVIGQGNWYGVFANGNLGGSGVKSFMIDHPNDPTGKYLRHFSIESPEVLNLYRGAVELDGQGQGLVQLPSYFLAANGDFSYQLTPVGAASVPFVAQEIDAQGQFRIAGGLPGQKICWVVYADRQDPYLQQHPESAEVEVAKRPADQGLYLQPELYGQGAEKGIFYRNRVQPDQVKVADLPAPHMQEMPIPQPKN